MDSIKDAFQKVKQDMDSLKEEIDSLRQGLVETRQTIIEMCEIMNKINERNRENKENQKKLPPTQEGEFPATPTHNPTHNNPLNDVKGQNIGISIGNEGVPTDRQTNQQTNQHTEKPQKILEKTDNNTINNAIEILESLDKIKKEIRFKFKRLTDQEMLVFSTLYQLEEENGFTDYRTISEKLKLTESSIRDYIGRLIKKGIPVDKNKVNNKNIQLNISKNLKKIVSLPTILQLRDL